jgi:type I restriction enzyme S subunit
MELLKEKRQAVISHAVTKGLNPHAPLKPSGIEWLGDVPAHWSVVPVKRLVEVKDGTHATPAYVDPAEDTYPLITSKDFGETVICFDEAKHISAADHIEVVRRSNTQQGDVLMSMIGGNIGKALIVRTDRPLSIKNVALFKTHQSEALAQYLLFYLQSGLLDVQIDLLSRGGAQGFMGLGDIRDLVFFKLPPSELETIVDFLKQESATFDTLTDEAQRAIDLLQERRTALISAAVTGQIDVCHTTIDIYEHKP